MSEATTQGSGPEFPIQTPGDFANATAREEPAEVFEGPDPVEPLPVLRHHLHELLLVVHDALILSESEDIKEAVRQGYPVAKTTPLSRRLQRQELTLEAYLGLLDEEDEDGEQDNAP